MAELQVIPARHGTATFVPAGQVIKIVNTSGTQVIDTWAFALPKPEPKKGAEAEKGGDSKEEPSKQSTNLASATKSTKKTADLPSQEDAEKATQDGLKQGEEDAENATPQKATWGSYVTSKVWSSKKETPKKPETEQQKDSRTWGSYFPSGKGFSNYIPKAATDTASAFVASHQRDPNKTYMEQLQEFSKTPVGAAGMAAMTGSGWAGSSWAGYQAWNVQNAANASPMEYMSMQHTRAATLHLRPKVNDTLVTNFREPCLTCIEDGSVGIHDTLIPACDPARYKGLGVENWQEHGSCAENLVLALKELNERAGLKGAKGIGAEININNVPAPLNLFMNIPWDDQGDVEFGSPKGKKNDFIRLKAERDVVVVMSACPQDIVNINGGTPTDAHFIVEESEEPAPALKRTQIRKRPPPRKISSSRATSSVAGESTTGVPQKRPAPQKRTVPATAGKPAAAAQKQTTAQPKKKKPVPRPVAPQKKPVPAATTTTDGTPAPAVERKKPRKLTSQSKVPTQATS